MTEQEYSQLETDIYKQIHNLIDLLIKWENYTKEEKNDKSNN